ncbi:hypothetical protein EC973_007227 [Apophysomyces ossiformis]|uniref:Uncharacterized protein n=1 Tax=Apophysomyces ossiformis TaxID=679940 RepID=A0A8H7BE60_9FUNG|nr:hypothetical protein EC973_007227 [Apophysomyces ossiformis]
MPTRPIPHGVRKSFSFSKKECETLKVHEAFADLTVPNWNSYETMVNQLLGRQNYGARTTDEARSILIKSFRSIKEKRQDYYSLCSFCKELVGYYKTSACKQAFERFYNQQVNLCKEQDEAGHIGDLAGAKLVTIGAIKAKLAIDKKANDLAKVVSSSTSEDTDGVEEIEQLLTKTEPDSLATKIKHEAFKLYKSYTHGKELSSNELHWMKCESIVNKFNAKYVVLPKPLTSSMNRTWDTVVALVEQTNGVAKSKQYLKQIATNDRETERMIDVIHLILDTFDKNEFILNEDNIEKVTESDFVVNVWGPLLKAIADVHGVIRMKSGESMNGYSTTSKKRTYNQSKGGSFKIDVRLLYDSKYLEHDLLAGEVGKDGNAEKIDHDLGKLLREAKDILDSSLQTMTKGLDKKPNGWFLHIDGLQGHLGTVHLASPGLYVAILQSKIRFPHNLSSIGNFKPCLEALMTIMSDVERRADLIRKSIDLIDDRRRSFGKKINRQDNNPIPAAPLSAHTRPTYYSPPHNDFRLAKLPFDLFGIVSQEHHDSVDSDQDTNDTITTEADKFGWMRCISGYYNIYTKTYSDTDPYIV